MAGPAPGFQKHPNHRVAITEQAGTVEVRLGDELVASTNRALRVEESRYPAVLYVPLDDIEASLREATDHSTYCPFKGHARYWTIHAGGRTLENALWGYDDPYAECLPLKGYGAFYADRVQTSVDGKPFEAQPA